MRVVSAYLLAVLGGNTAPGAADIKKICDAGGVSVDDDRVAAFLKAMEGKDLQELLSEGRSKLASMPAAGAVAAAPAAGGAADAAAPAEEEKKVEEESEDEDMGFDLFD